MRKTNKPYLVGKRRAEPKSAPTTRLSQGDFIADIIENRKVFPRVYHWIIQRKGSVEIETWGQERTFEEAEWAAKSYMERSATRRQKRRA